MSGRVTSQADGEPLPGVNVVVKGTSTGTVTDADGTYGLEAPSPNDTLVFSYVGFLTREVPIAGRSAVDVEMGADEVLLDDVVVVGYGQQKRRRITGAVSSVEVEAINDLPVKSIDEALAGKIPGVQVQQMTGAPGGGINIRVRGTGSLSAGTQPLYVIDGFPVGTNEDLSVRDNPLSTISPEDIASIDVLKDASATAIYGSRGANGVILITTKQGKAGEPRFEFDSYVGSQQLFRKIDLTNAWEYAELYMEAQNHLWVDMDPENNSPTDPNEVRPQNRQIAPWYRHVYDNRLEGTDWQDELYQNAPMQSYALTASGGTERARYYVSGSLFDQQGIIQNSDFTRYSMRVNLDAKLSDRLAIGLNLSPTYTQSTRTLSEGVPWTNGMVLRTLLQNPTYPARDEEGDPVNEIELGEGFGTASYWNPLFRAFDVTDQNRRLRALGTVFADLKLRDDLVFRTQLGADASTFRAKFYEPGYTKPNTGLSSAENQTNLSLNWLSENTLTYNTESRSHAFDALAGFTAQRNYYEGNALSATNFPNDLVRTLNAGQVVGGYSNESEWSMLSFLARVNYAFRDKYLLTATIRRDGSSRFGANNKWGTFPSGSVGWFISEEPFLRGVPHLNSLKVRASYGLTGNNSIPNYGHISLLGGRDYLFGPNQALAPGLYPRTFPNPDLTWEVARQADVGLDMGLFGNRIYVVADYYHKITTDLLLNVPVPQVTGYTSALENIGEIRNTGFEFAVSTKNLVGELEWSTDFNIAFNRNKVLALGPGGEPLRARTWLGWTHLTEVGEPLGNFYGYEKDGVFQDWEEVAAGPIYGQGTSNESVPGTDRFVDQNGDGLITDEDRTVVGNAMPDYIFGITNHFSFKGFDLRVLIDGVQGNDLINHTWQYIANVRGGQNAQTRDVYEGRWRSLEEPGDGWIPRLNMGQRGYTAQWSSYYVEDGSYWRIRNVVFGYRLPRSMLRYVGSARIYVGVENAFMFTNYSGYNPDISESGTNPLSLGVDHGGYPLQRIYTAGLNIGF